PRQVLLARFVGAKDQGGPFEFQRESNATCVILRHRLLLKSEASKSNHQSQQRQKTNEETRHQRTSFAFVEMAFTLTHRVVLHPRNLNQPQSSVGRGTTHLAGD